MSKKLIHGAVIFVTVFLAMVAMGITRDVIEAKSKDPKPAYTGHPDASKIYQPTVLTKHELFSEDHTSDIVAIQQVWAAYTYYNDAHDGEGMASLFTEDAVDQHFWNNYGTLVPHYGIVADGDTTTNTPEGQRGSGCVLHGRKEIAQYFGPNRQKDPWPWPGHSHHETPSILVKVGDDGKTAVMSAPYVIAGVNEKGEGHVATGGYRAFFRKTSEGWEVAELYAIDDHPHVTKQCDVHGPLPRAAK